MRVEPRDISQLVGFKPMDLAVLCGEVLLERLAAAIRALRHALAEQAVEALVGALLAAALQDHCDNLNGFLLRQLQLHDLVRTLLEARGRHDRQVELSSQVGLLRLRHADIGGLTRATLRDRHDGVRLLLIR